MLTAYTGLEAVELARQGGASPFLMDGCPAWTVLRPPPASGSSPTPIIFLTAKSETEDLVLGLNMGATTISPSPFVPVEVLARVRSQLRRYARLGSRPEETGEVWVGAIAINDNTKTARGGPPSI